MGGTRWPLSHSCWDSGPFDLLHIIIAAENPCGLISLMVEISRQHSIQAVAYLLISVRIQVHSEQEYLVEGWRDGSVVKSADCSSKGSEFKS